MSPVHPRLALSFRGLLSIYAVIPLCLVAVLLDSGLFHGALRRALPDSPEDLRLLSVFIVLPHIVASALSFAEQEYLGFYKQRLFLAVPVVLGAVYVLPASARPPASCCIRVTPSSTPWRSRLE